MFHHLANLPIDCGSINKTLNRRGKKIQSQTSVQSNVAKPLATGPEFPMSPTSPTSPMEGSRPAMPAEPGTLKATLMDVPGIDKMTEKESAHPSQRQVDTF